MEGDTEISLETPSTSRQYRNSEQVSDSPLSFSTLKNTPPQEQPEGDINEESPLRSQYPKPQTATDRERLDAGKNALRELLKDRKQVKSNKKSCGSVLKVYITILAALLVIGGLFILIFLIPMTIDPALATLVYDIDPNPALCMTNSSQLVNPAQNKTWCSCSEGCTKDIYSCHQIVVRYRKGFFQLKSSLRENFNVTAFDIRNRALAKTIKGLNHNYPFAGSGTNEACDSSNWIYNDDCWHSLNSSLLVNIKGCGYPPHVNCSLFLKSFQSVGRRFLCYYSKVNPSIVITNYDPDKPWNDLVQSLLWTCGSQVIGTIILLVLHCPFKAVWKSISDRNTKKKPIRPADKWREVVRQPVFNKDWYEVNT